MDISTERLGKVMEEDNLKEVDNLLNEAKLPILPYDPSLHEMQLLLTYHGNRLAYLMSSNEIVEGKIRDKKAEYDEAYNLAYKEVRERNTDLNATAVKNVVLLNSKVKKIHKELLDLQHLQSVMQAEIAGLQEQNICLRKVASLQTLAIERGLQ